VGELGGLDICVANAGVVREDSVLTMGERDWDTVMGTVIPI
jgi:NADP-dependent 3-hydroxy acid dehydrogenase YdfG